MADQDTPQDSRPPLLSAADTNARQTTQQSEADWHPPLLTPEQRLEQAKNQVDGMRAQQDFPLGGLEPPLLIGRKIDVVGALEAPITPMATHSIKTITDSLKEHRELVGQVAKDPEVMQTMAAYEHMDVVRESLLQRLTNKYGKEYPDISFTPLAPDSPISDEDRQRFKEFYTKQDEAYSAYKEAVSHAIKERGQDPELDLSDGQSKRDLLHETANDLLDCSRTGRDPSQVVPPREIRESRHQGQSR